MLHQKEIILNADDTTNLLSAVSIIRDIVQMIDLQAMQHSGFNISSPSIGFTGSEMLEQAVHIEASFPGVTDRNEIEEAFNNLINTASQYANRKS